MSKNFEAIWRKSAKVIEYQNFVTNSVFQRRYTAGVKPKDVRFALVEKHWEINFPGLKRLYTVDIEVEFWRCPFLLP